MSKLGGSGTSAPKPAKNKYAKVIGPVAGNKARQYKRLLKSPDAATRMHAQAGLNVLNRRLAAKNAKTAKGKKK